ncbi:hypothetical protein RQP46_003309 [Phenoliferia psychrophenolica]
MDKIEQSVEKTVESLEKGDADSVSRLVAWGRRSSVVEAKLAELDSPVRYLAFGARLRPIVQPLTRYLAYTSDVGESFRPVVSPKLVTAAYGVSWAYLIGDVGFEGYKARLRAVEFAPDAQGSVVGLTMAKRAIFQSTASMLGPALTIHSVVKYSAKYIAASNIKSVKVKAWGPTVLGLSIVPALPFIFDEPVEHVVDAGFDMLEERLFKDQPNIRQALSGHKQEDVKES